MEVSLQKFDLLEKRLADFSRGVFQGFLSTGEVINLHRERLVFLATALFLRCAFMWAIISSALLKGPKLRPALKSASDSSRRASMIRRCSGVYSSSADGSSGMIL